MTVSVKRAAKTLISFSDKGKTHLRIQKELYFAQMYCLSVYNRPLIDEEFQAWEHGSVVSTLYDFLKMFGKRHITTRDLLLIQKLPKSSQEYQLLKTVSDELKDFSDPDLVDINHRAGGAYKTTFEGERIGVIPNEAIKQDYIKFSRGAGLCQTKLI